MWIMGRHDKECFFWKDRSGQWLLYSDKDPRFHPRQEVLDGFNAARAAVSSMANSALPPV